ncbi:TPA: hypothetical protein ACFP4A_002135, partial [Neisseria subflava]
IGWSSEGIKEKRAKEKDVCGHVLWGERDYSLQLTKLQLANEGDEIFSLVRLAHYQFSDGPLL